MLVGFSCQIIANHFVLLLVVTVGPSQHSSSKSRRPQRPGRTQMHPFASLNRWHPVRWGQLRRSRRRASLEYGSFSIAIHINMNIVFLCFQWGVNAFCGSFFCWRNNTNDKWKVVLAVASHPLIFFESYWTSSNFTKSHPTSIGNWSPISRCLHIIYTHVFEIT